MKRIFLPFTLLLSAIFLCVSCLDSDEIEYTYYSDTAITTFSISSFNQTMHTLSSMGFDSTYIKSVDGSTYKFYIDQIKREIYNPDSLPMTADSEHLLCNMQAKNGGMVLFKKVNNDSLVYYSGSDSIDLSVPREVRAYSNSGEFYRAYTVKVNVHKEDPDSFRWNLLGNAAPIAEMKALRAVYNSNRIYVFGTDGMSTYVYYSDVNDGRNWTSAVSNVNGASNMVFDADAYDNVVVKDGYIYIMCNGGRLMKSENACDWQVVTTEPLLKRIVGAGAGTLYGIGDAGMMVSYDDGTTWEQDNMDDGTEWLPSQNISCAITQIATNKDTHRVLIIGNRDYDTNPADTTAMVWGRMEETAITRTNPWVFYTPDEYNTKKLPRLEGLAVLNYGGSLLAMGGKGIGDTAATAYDMIYVSNDNGLTWHSDSRFYYPAKFERTATAVTVVKDDANCMWIICSGTGQIWRGRLNKLGWDETKTSFTE